MSENPYRRSLDEIHPAAPWDEGYAACAAERDGEVEFAREKERDEAIEAFTPLMAAAAKHTPDTVFTVPKFCERCKDDWPCAEAAALAALEDDS